MKRIDLDDLPPKLAALLVGTAEDEDVLLVQNGCVVGRLRGAKAGADAARPEPQLAPEENAKEIFEQFRAAIEDEF